MQHACGWCGAPFVDSGRDWKPLPMAATSRGGSGNADLLRAHPEAFVESRCEVCRAHIAGDIGRFGNGASILEQGFLRCQQPMFFQIVKDRRAEGEAKVALQGFHIDAEAPGHVVERQSCHRIGFERP